VIETRLDRGFHGERQRKLPAFARELNAFAKLADDLLEGRARRR
jgi:hypothetical protein